MDKTSFNIIFLVLEAFNILIAHSVFTSFFGREKEDRHKRFFIYVTYLSCKVLLVSFIGSFLSSFLIDLLFLMWVSTHYRKSIINKIPLTLIVSFIIALVREFAILCFHEDINKLRLLMLGKLFLYVISITLYVVLYYRKIRNVSYYDVFLTMIVPILSIELFNASLDIENMTWRIISIITISMIDFSSFLSYELMIVYNVQGLEKVLLEQEKQFYQGQCELMQESLNEAKAIKHDINNQLTVLSSLIEKNKSAAASKQWKTLTNLIKADKIYSETGNIPIDSLINYKLRNAVSDNIKVESKVSVPDQLNIETTDMVIILGNLLDNAIEAVMKVDAKSRMISVFLRFIDDSLLLQITNTYQSAFSDCYHLITTKNDRLSHGYGISNIQNAVDKYHGYFKTYINDNIFTAEVLLYFAK